MRKAELLQLHAYTDYVWGEIRRVVPDAELSRVAEGSGWPALRNCLGHMTLAYQRWAPAILNLRTGDLPAIGAEDFLSWSQLDEARSRLLGPLREHLEMWSEEELAATRNVDVDGEIIHYSRGELLAHTLLHERGHHGDVTTLFWQLKIEAPTRFEYRFFLGREQD